MVMHLSIYVILFILRSLPLPHSELLLAPPSTKTKKTLGDTAFTAAVRSLWNKLPSEIREEENFERFKSKLKTFLFRAAYPMKSS